MKSLIAAATALSLTLGSCNTHQHQPAAETTAPQSAEDSLYKSVLALHDEAMPKMGKLMGLQKTAQQQIDSLKALGNAGMAPQIQRLENLKSMLGQAEQGMNDWMTQFDPDPKMATTEERAAYFADQQAKARQMRDAIFAALDSAAIILSR
jgi:DNA repair protein RadC